MTYLILLAVTILCFGILRACIAIGQRTINGDTRDVVASLGALVVVVGALCVTGALAGGILAVLNNWTRT